MISLIQLIIKDPRTGLIALLSLVCMYMWREQGKIKSELKNVEKGLDSKKLDKEDHLAYAEYHRELHKEGNRQTNIIITLLEKLSK